MEDDAADQLLVENGRMLRTRRPPRDYGEGFHEEIVEVAPLAYFSLK